MVDNVSQGRSQPAHITGHEIEGVVKEERETDAEFGDHIGNFVYGFYLWYS